MNKYKVAVSFLILLGIMLGTTPTQNKMQAAELDRNIGKKKPN